MEDDRFYEQAIIRLDQAMQRLQADDPDIAIALSLAHSAVVIAGALRRIATILEEAQVKE